MYIEGTIKLFHLLKEQVLLHAYQIRDDCEWKIIRKSLMVKRGFIPTIISAMSTSSCPIALSPESHCELGNSLHFLSPITCTVAIENKLRPGLQNCQFRQVDIRGLSNCSQRTAGIWVTWTANNKSSWTPDGSRRQLTVRQFTAMSWKQKRRINCTYSASPIWPLQLRFWY